MEDLFCFPPHTHIHTHLSPLPPPGLGSPGSAADGHGIHGGGNGGSESTGEAFYNLPPIFILLVNLVFLI